MEAVFYILYYYVEMIKFVLGYKTIYQERIEKEWLYLIGSLPYIVYIVSLRNTLNDNNLLPAYFILLLITVIVSSDNIWKGIKKLIILEVFLNVLDSEVYAVFKLLNIEETDDIGNTLFINVIRCLCIVFVYLVKKTKILKKVRKMDQDRYSFMGAIFLTIITVGITILCYGIDFYPEYLKKILLWAVFFSFGSVFFVIRIIIDSDEKNEKLKNLIDIEKKMSSVKESYFEVLLDKEEETRRYRHDMMNHYICIKDMLDSKKYDEVNMYIDTLMNRLESIRNKNLVIGNRIIEALTNYYISLLPEDTQVEVSGIIGDDIDIKENYLSSIYGNILSNAIEELSRIKNNSKLLKIKFSQGQQYIGITIINSVTNKKIIKDNVIITSKEDKHNHGFGMMNVNETVERCNGKIEYFCDDSTFKVELVLKRLKYNI